MAGTLVVLVDLGRRHRLAVDDEDVLAARLEAAQHGVRRDALGERGGGQRGGARARPGRADLFCFIVEDLLVWSREAGTPGRRRRQPLEGAVTRPSLTAKERGRRR